VSDVREQLLDAAQEILRAKGIMGATTREIARAAKVADGTLYNHFRTREQLFMALFERLLPVIRETLNDLPMRVGHGEVTATLVEVLVASLGFFREVVPLFAAVISDPDLNATYRAEMGAQNRGPHRAYAWIEKYLQAEQRMARIGKAVDPTTTAQQLIAIAFFQAFVERFMAATPSAAADKRWATAQIAAITADWS
jgi:AcrR family transcriptional regulator